MNTKKIITIITLSIIFILQLFITVHAQENVNTQTNNISTLTLQEIEKLSDNHTSGTAGPKQFKERLTKTYYNQQNWSYGWGWNIFFFIIAVVGFISALMSRYSNIKQYAMPILIGSEAILLIASIFIIPNFLSIVFSFKGFLLTLAYILIPILIIISFCNIKENGEVSLSIMFVLSVFSLSFIMPNVIYMVAEQTKWGTMYWLFFIASCFFFVEIAEAIFNTTDGNGNKILELEQKNRYLLSENNNLTNQVNRYKQIEQRSNDYKEKIKVLSQTNNDIQEKINSLEKDKQKADAEINKLNRKLNNIVQTLVNITNEKERLQKTTDRLSNSISKNKDKINEQEDLITQKDRIISEQEDKINEQEDIISNSNNLLNNLQQQQNELEQTIQALNAEISAKESEIYYKNSEIKNKTRQIYDLIQVTPENLTSETIERLKLNGSITEKSVTIPFKYTHRTKNYKIIGMSPAVFKNNEKIESVIIDAPITFIDSSVFEGCTSLQTIKMPKNIVKISYSAFKNCDSLTTIEIPDTITSIEKGAFKDCKVLENVRLPKNEKFSTIEQSVFEGCKELKNITIPNNVKNIKKSAFENCNALEKINLPNGIKTIEETTFKDCGNLTNIKLPNSIEIIKESAFNGCKSLKEIHIPDSVKEIGKNAFNNTLLAKIYITKNIENIEEGMFESCTSLEKIIIPNNIKNIKRRAFFGCKSLKEIFIPNSVESIGESAFNGCKSLKEIHIPSSVKEIGDDAFSDIETVYYSGAADGEPWGADSVETWENEESEYKEFEEKSYKNLEEEKKDLTKLDQPQNSDELEIELVEDDEVFNPNSNIVEENIGEPKKKVYLKKNYTESTKIEDKTANNANDKAKATVLKINKNIFDEALEDDNTPSQTLNKDDKSSEIHQNNELKTSPKMVDGKIQRNRNK